MAPGKPGCERRWCERSIDGARKKVSAGGRKEAAVAERRQNRPKREAEFKSFLRQPGAEYFRNEGTEGRLTSDRPSG